MSADLATLFTGRYIEIHVFPFSFREYCQFYDDISDKDKLFDEYAIKGDLAGSYAYKTEKDRTNYIKEVYETIVTRDLVQKYALPDTLVLQRLSEFLMDNISNLTSPNKVSQLLTANETPTNHVTVGKYIKYLCNAFVFYDIKRYDIRGKKYLESSEKFYLCDSGIRYAILGSRNMDYGRVYENIVCIFMSASSIKRKSTLLLREAARRFIFRSATTFPGRKHLRENTLLCFRFEMLIRK